MYVFGPWPIDVLTFDLLSDNVCEDICMPHTSLWLCPCKSQTSLHVLYTPCTLSAYMSLYTSRCFCGHIHLCVALHALWPCMLPYSPVAMYAPVPIHPFMSPHAQCPLYTYVCPYGYVYSCMNVCAIICPYGHVCPLFSHKPAWSPCTPIWPCTPLYAPYGLWPFMLLCSHMQWRCMPPTFLYAPILIGSGGQSVRRIFPNTLFRKCMLSNNRWISWLLTSQQWSPFNANCRLRTEITRLKLHVHVTQLYVYVRRFIQVCYVHWFITSLTSYITSVQPSMVMHWNTVSMARPKLSKLVMPLFGPFQYSSHIIPSSHE